MEIRPIKTKKQYQEYLDWIDLQFEKKIRPHSPAGVKLQVILILIKHYEDNHFLIPKQ